MEFILLGLKCHLVQEQDKALMNLTTNRQYMVPIPFPVIALFYIKTDKIYIYVFPVKQGKTKLL